MRVAGCPSLPPHLHTFERRPAEQANGAKDEDPDDDLVLVAVTLEAHGGNVVLGRVLAEGDALAEAEGLCALGARGGGGAAVFMVGVEGAER